MLQKWTNSVPKSKQVLLAVHGNFPVVSSRLFDLCCFRFLALLTVSCTPTQSTAEDENLMEWKVQRRLDCIAAINLGETSQTLHCWSCETKLESEHLLQCYRHFTILQVSWCSCWCWPWIYCCFTTAGFMAECCCTRQKALKCWLKQEGFSFLRVCTRTHTSIDSLCR